MKPLYAILLVFGAALAAGLAFHLTEPQPIRVAANAPSPPPVTAPQSAPAPKPVLAPPSVAPYPKPSPMPPTFTSAPPAVYQEPTPAPAPARPHIANQSPARVASARPLQWMPVPYQHVAGNTAPLRTLATKPAQPEPKVETKVEPRVEAKLETPPSPPVVEAPRPEPRHVTLATGMTIAVRLSEPLSAERATAGDHFRGALVEPLVADGLVIAERGAHVTGRVVGTQKQSWASRKSLLEIELSTVSTSDGQEVTLPTDPWIIIGGDQPASASTGTVARFRLAGKVTVSERPL